MLRGRDERVKAGAEHAAGPENSEVRGRRPEFTSVSGRERDRRIEWRAGENSEVREQKSECRMADWTRSLRCRCEQNRHGSPERDLLCCRSDCTDPYVVVRRGRNRAERPFDSSDSLRATSDVVFPGSGRPRDCLGGSVCRTAARYANPFN